MSKHQTNNEINGLENDVENYIYSWHRFAIDYWWRKKYNVPYNSPQHRQANFIDMLIEYREEMVLQRERNRIDKEREDKENKSLGLKDDKEVVHMTQQEIEEEYENLDLSQFDNK